VSAVSEQKTLSLSSAIFQHVSPLPLNMVRDSMSKYLFSDLHRGDSLRTMSLSTIALNQGLHIGCLHCAASCVSPL
jgi:hypothetical protein